MTLGEALPREMARVRDDVLPIYEALGKPGRLCVIMARAHLDEAARALASGDVVKMLAAHEDLKGYTL